MLDGFHQSLFERDIYDELFSRDVHNVAESPVPPPREVQANSATAYAEVPNVQVIQPFRQHRIDDVKLFSVCAWPDSKHRRENKEQRPRCPCLR